MDKVSIREQRAQSGFPSHTDSTTMQNDAMLPDSVTLVLDQNRWPPHPSLNPFIVHNLFSTGLHAPSYHTFAMRDTFSSKRLRLPKITLHRGEEEAW